MLAALAAALALAAASVTVRAQTSSVECTYAEWELNSGGDTACEVWAQLQDLCVPGTKVGSITNVTAPYPPPTGTTANECNCNVVAYNLMAGCSWCQKGIRTDDWVDEDAWADKCTSYDSVGLPSSVEDRLQGIVIPKWAQIQVSGSGWVPSYAEDAAESSATGGGLPSGTKTSSGLGAIDTSWADDGPWSGGDDCVGCHSDIDTDKLWSIVGAVLGVFLGGPAVAFIIGLIIHFVRQNNRKKFYGPLAEYYRNGGAPPAGLPTRAAGAFYPGPSMQYAQQQQQYYAGPGPSAATDGSNSPRPQSFGAPQPQSFNALSPQPGTASPPQAYAVPGQPVAQMPWSPVQFPQAGASTSGGGGGSPPPAPPVGAYVHQSPPAGAYVHQPPPGVPMV